MDALLEIRDASWLYVAGPLLLLCAVVLTIRLRAPQLTKLGLAFRAVREHDEDAAGDTAPGLSTVLGAVGAYGAAAAVGAATAVSLGGAGAIGWVWLFCFLLAPLHYAEVLLARTDRPGGGAAEETGSLARRVLREDGPARALGWTLIALLAASAFAFFGGVHGAALSDASRHLLPDGAAYLVAGVAVVGAALAAAGPARGGAVAGWIGLAGLVVLTGAAIWAAASEPGRAFGAIARAITEAFEGTPPAEPFIGAFAGEVAFGAIVFLLPPLVGGAGSTGALHALARARTTRGQAAAALLGPLALAIVTTLLGMAFIGTGSHYRRVEDRIAMSEVEVYRVAPTTPSQHAETDRLYGSHLRIIAGELRDTGLTFFTERGPIQVERFEYYGRPADMAVKLAAGRVERLQRPQNGRALGAVPVEQASLLYLHGRMLPRRAALLNAAMIRGTGGPIGARLSLSALLVLAAVAAAALGLGLSRSLPSTVPPTARAAAGVVPSAGLGLWATGLTPWLEPVGYVAAAALASVVAIILIWLSGQVAALKR